MDAGNAVTPLSFPNFQIEVLALVDASAVDSSAVPTLLRFPLAGRETLAVSALSCWTQYFPFAVHSPHFRSCGNMFTWHDDSLVISFWAMDATKVTQRLPLTLVNQASFSHCKARPPVNSMPACTQSKQSKIFQLIRDELRWSCKKRHNSKTQTNDLTW